MRKVGIVFVPIFTELHAIADGTVSSEESMKNAFHYLQLKTKKVIESII